MYISVSRWRDNASLLTHYAALPSTAARDRSCLALALGARRLRQPVPGNHPVVVEPQHPDHVLDVRLVFDPARRRSDPAREDRVVDDATLLPQLGPDLLREREVCGVIAVQVADLARADLEGELAARARP